MSGKGWLPAVMGILLACSCAHADPPLIEGVLNGPAALDEIFEGNGYLQREGCLEPDCLALNDIAHSFELMRERDTPNGLTLFDPKSFNLHDFDHRIRHLLAQHPARRPLYCQILSEIAHHYDDQSEDVVGRWDIEIAALISPSCAHAVVSALPRSKAVKDLLAYAYERCVPDEPGCRFMIREPNPTAH